MDYFKTETNRVSKESKQLGQKREIIALLRKSDLPLTIPVICKEVRLSVPTGTKLVNELIDEKFIVEAGKIETENGRRPVVYKVNPQCGYIIGVEILLKRLSVSVFDIEMHEVYVDRDKSFILENTSDCLEYVINFLEKSIHSSAIQREKILGVGVGITGRVNSISGESYNFFNFPEEGITSFLSKKLQLPVFVDNDTHIIGLSELFFGQAKDVRNALIVNLSRGLGLAIILNGELVPGDNGFAGEFGHMQFGDSTKLCMCGKRGCLGMEVSGFALEENFKEKVEEGESSLLLSENKGLKIRYDAILNAAWEGDALSISLLHDIGFKLGKALGNITNLLNPGQIIIGGKFAVARGVLADAIKSGMTHTTLSQPLRSCQISFSEMGENNGLKGAAAQVLSHYRLI
ncbi:ROK family transcriptional regulator [Puteibacter caeruleilacunae]|nr:ROK family transcriptional regulator [Puteibacter caeruleilacunae]